MEDDLKKRRKKKEDNQKEKMENDLKNSPSSDFLSA